MIIQTWGNVLGASFQNLWMGFLSYVPNLVIAIIILVIGWAVGAFLMRLVEQLFRSLKIDNLLRSAGVDDVLTKGGLKLNSGAFVGELVKWFIILAFLVASLDVLKLEKVTDFLRYIVLIKIPQVIVAVLIILVAAVVAQIVQKFVVASAKAAQMHSANFAGVVAKWAIWGFAIIISLSQVGIADDFLLTFFTGVIVAVSLALGLAFGLGGQAAAARYLDKVQQEISNR